MEDVGQLISEFVEERVENPREGEQELWSTGVSACLFSVAFEVLVHRRDLTKGQEACEDSINAALDATARHAAKWIDQRLGRTMLPAEKNLPPIHVDLYPEIRRHLNIYFDEALTALAQRGYAINVARSHACFAMLGSAIEEMILRGWIKDANLAANFRQNYFERAESMSLEIRHLLEKKAKS